MEVFTGGVFLATARTISGSNQFDRGAIETVVNMLPGGHAL